ncbi:MAG: methanethiol S-methyltransferase [Pirellulales bacterium]
MKRWLFFTYGTASYLLFFALYAYMACFVGGFAIPHTIDSPAGGAVAPAVAVNVALLLLFGLQHSVMARPWFKSIWTRIVPTPIERSTYMYASTFALVLLMWAWRPIDAIVWHVEQPALRTAAWALFVAGWLAVPAVSYLINHFDLFGMRQVWLYLRGREYTSLPFRTPLAYNHVRHPLYVGWTLAFWATPTMTAGHLLFAIVMTLYMGIAAIFEERDLVAHFGEQYAEYRRRVPMFVPQFTKCVPQIVERIDEGSLSSVDIMAR